jgi:hypothetical protein
MKGWLCLGNKCTRWLGEVVLYFFVLSQRYVSTLHVQNIIRMAPVIRNLGRT